MTDEEYLEKWLDCSVTLDDWLSHPKEDHWNFVDAIAEHEGFEDYMVRAIEEHQVHLFNQLVEKTTNNLINKFKNGYYIELIPNIINEHLKIINNFFKNRDLSHLAIRELNLIYSVNYDDAEDIFIEFKKQNLYTFSWDSRKETQIRKPSSYHNSVYLVAAIFSSYSVKITKLIPEVEKDLQEMIKNFNGDYTPAKVNTPNNPLTKIIEHSFDTFVDTQKQNYILDMLENLSITNNGSCILSDKKKSAIRGIIEALLEENLVPHLSLAKLTTIIANKINLEIKSKLDASTTSDDYKKKAIKYIKNNPLN